MFQKTCIFLVFIFTTFSVTWDVYLLITCRCYLQIFGQIQLPHNKIIGKWHWSDLCTVFISISCNLIQIISIYVTPRVTVMMVKTCLCLKSYIHSLFLLS
jgi:hypothetical protein